MRPSVGLNAAQARRRDPQPLSPQDADAGVVRQYNWSGVKHVGAEFVYWLATMQDNLLCVTINGIAISTFPQGRFRYGILDLSISQGLTKRYLQTPVKCVFAIRRLFASYTFVYPSQTLFQVHVF